MMTYCLYTAPATWLGVTTKKSMTVILSLTTKNLRPCYSLL